MALQMTLIDAIDTLSTIADLEETLGLTKTDEELEEELTIKERALAWIEQGDSETIEARIREIFRVILRYLQDFYQREQIDPSEWKHFHAVKSIMVLVGEATHKLDHYTRLFHGAKVESCMRFQEYRELHDFYFNTLAQDIEKGVAQKVEGTQEEKRALQDVEKLKRDRDYELFFIRDEKGRSYVNPLLAENIRLVCDFEPYALEYAVEDPLLQVPQWYDRVYQMTAVHILQAVHTHLDLFFSQVRKHMDMEIVPWLNEALIALLLAANPRNLLRNLAMKPSSHYFADFQSFLRQALLSSDYQRYVAYPPSPHKKFARCLVNVTQGLCHAIYVHVQANHELSKGIHKIIKDGAHLMKHEKKAGHAHTRSLTDELLHDYACIEETLKRHPNGPLFKIIDLLRENRREPFDVLLQGNLPEHFIDFFVDDVSHSLLRLASPTQQEMIHRAHIDDEYKAFLRDCRDGAIKKNCLVINLQDRTSWQEHARSEGLERLQTQREFAGVLTVVTLAKDTDFYHQQGPYEALGQAKEFMQQLKEHLQSDQGGYFFPPQIAQELSEKHLSQMMKAIHRLFFDGATVLSRVQRQDFIELFYLFLELKLLDILQPSYVSLTCKDAVDCGLAASGALFVGAKLLTGHALNEKEKERLEHMIFVPPLLIREREMDPERFQRMISALKTIEDALHRLGHKHFDHLVHEEMAPLYQRPILSMHISVPKSGDYTNYQK